MSFGYDAMPWNTGILNTFAYLGIYSYVHYLFLEFYKGGVMLHYQLLYEEDSKLEMSGCGTTEIIYHILTLTVLSDNKCR